MTLALDNVTKSFGSVAVLQGLSARFEPGTVTAIVGDNGAGKSTLLKLISGIHRADGGTLTLGSDAITDWPVATRRRQGIEMIYQDLALVPQRSVLANIFLGREASLPWLGFLKHRAMQRQANAHLATLGIALADLDRPVGILSGGQQQAVAIARATLFEPKVLLLDEPTAALGVGQVDRVLDSIRREKEAGRILLLVSHRFNDVFAVADRIIVMKQGRIASDLPVAATSIAQTVETIVSHSDG